MAVLDEHIRPRVRQALADEIYLQSEGAPPAALRGIRDVSDLRYEFQLALANRAVGGIETVFIMAGDHYALTSSSLIRQVVALGGDVRQLRAILPDLVVDELYEKQKGSALLAAEPDAPAT